MKSIGCINSFGFSFVTAKCITSVKWRTLWPPHIFFKSLITKTNFSQELLHLWIEPHLCSILYNEQKNVFSQDFLKVIFFVNLLLYERVLHLKLSVLINLLLFLDCFYGQNDILRFISFLFFKTILISIFPFLKILDGIF